MWYLLFTYKIPFGKIGNYLLNNSLSLVHSNINYDCLNLSQRGVQFWRWLTAEWILFHVAVTSFHDVLADFCWWGLRQVTSLRSRQFTMCSPETPHKCTLQKEIYLIQHLKKCFETWTSLVAVSNGDAISYVANTTDKIYEYEWSATKNAGQKYSKHHYSFKPCVCLSTNEIELYVSKN